MGERYIEINYAKGGKLSQPQLPKTQPNTNCRTIFIKNLPYDCTEDEVGNLFKHCGKIESIRFAKNTLNKNFKGLFWLRFGYIDFAEAKALEKAIKLNGEKFKGRTLFIVT